MSFIKLLIEARPKLPQNKTEVQILKFVLFNFIFEYLKSAMSKKSIQNISRLWRKTSFNCLLQPSQQEMNFICDRFQKILSGFSTFQKVVLGAMKEIRLMRFNIPALAKIKQEILKNRTTIQTLIKDQIQTTNTLIKQLGQFRYVLHKSEMNAFQEYNQIMDYFLNQKSAGMSLRKIQQIHDHFKVVDVQSKQAIRNRVSANKFQRWMADFSIRSEKFFEKAYSPFWENQAEEPQASFVSLKTEKYLQHLCFNRNKSIIQIVKHSLQGQETCNENSHRVARKGHLRSSDHMDEEQGDIVSQIYKEFEKNPKRQQ